MKTLLSYNCMAVIPFGDGEYKYVYELTMLKSFFGFFKREIKCNYEISMFGNVKDYQEHWDSLIESKKRL